MADKSADNVVQILLETVNQAIASGASQEEAAALAQQAFEAMPPAEFKSMQATIEASPIFVSAATDAGLTDKNGALAADWAERTVSSSPLSNAPSGPPTADQAMKIVREEAAKRGIDPDVAARIAMKEGYRSSAGGAGAFQSDVKKNGVREPSYGLFQLHERGVGAGFQAKTGYALTDPSLAAERARIQVALDHAAQRGWGDWYGRNTTTDGTSKIGVREGLSGARAVGVASASPAMTPPLPSLRPSTGGDTLTAQDRALNYLPTLPGAGRIDETTPKSPDPRSTSQILAESRDIAAQRESILAGLPQRGAPSAAPPPAPQQQTAAATRLPDAINKDGSRNIAPSPALAIAVGDAITNVYGPGYTYQARAGIALTGTPGARSERHDTARGLSAAADWVIKAPDGHQLAGAELEPLTREWVANYGSIGVNGRPEYPGHDGKGFTHMDLVRRSPGEALWYYDREAIDGSFASRATEQAIERTAGTGQLYAQWGDPQQIMLERLGYASVEDFQRDHGLTADGIVGKETLTAFAAAAETLPASTQFAFAAEPGPAPAQQAILDYLPPIPTQRPARPGEGIVEPQQRTARPELGLPPLPRPEDLQRRRIERANAAPAPRNLPPEAIPPQQVAMNLPPLPRPRAESAGAITPLPNARPSMDVPLPRLRPGADVPLPNLRPQMRPAPPSPPGDMRAPSPGNDMFAPPLPGLPGGFNRALGYAPSNRTSPGQSAIDMLLGGDSAAPADLSGPLQEALASGSDPRRALLTPPARSEPRPATPNVQVAKVDPMLNLASTVYEQSMGAEMPGYREAVEASYRPANMLADTPARMVPDTRALPTLPGITSNEFNGRFAGADTWSPVNPTPAASARMVQDTPARMVPDRAVTATELPAVAQPPDLPFLPGMNEIYAGMMMLPQTPTGWTELPALPSRNVEPPPAHPAAPIRPTQPVKPASMQPSLPTLRSTARPPTIGQRIGTAANGYFANTPAGRIAGLISGALQPKVNPQAVRNPDGSFALPTNDSGSGPWSSGAVVGTAPSGGFTYSYDPNDPSQGSYISNTTGQTFSYTRDV